jgi:uncharacterized membrane protein YdjX (TVP38/TMEM64 family)
MEERTALWRFIRTGLAVVGLVAFMYVVWSAYDHAAVMHWIRGLKPLQYFTLIALLPAIGFPTTPLYVLAGASFGILVGLVGSWISLAVNAALCFWIARWMRPMFERLLRRFHAELPDISRRERGNLRLALGVKLAPGAPTFVKQYALGMSGISFRLYMTVTMLVSGVYVAAFVVIGESLLDHRPGRTAGALAVLAALIAAAIWYSRRKSRASALPPAGLEPQPW